MGTKRSSGLYEMLMRQGLSAKVGGTTEVHGMKMGERSDALDPQSAAAKAGVTPQEGCSGVRLAWVNPTAMRKRAGYRAPLLMVIAK